MDAQRLDLVFYGDSITESWRGTSLGTLFARCAGSPDVFEKYFSSKYTTKVLGVACKSPCSMHQPVEMFIRAFSVSRSPCMAALQPVLIIDWVSSSS